MRFLSKEQILSTHTFNDDIKDCIAEQRIKKCMDRWSDQNYNSAIRLAANIVANHIIPGHSILEPVLQSIIEHLEASKKIIPE